MSPPHPAIPFELSDQIPRSADAARALQRPASVSMKACRWVAAS